MVLNKYAVSPNAGCMLYTGGDLCKCMVVLEARTSSGTARMLVKPLRKTTNTRLAPQRRADVAQSNAVSPAPRTITLPCSEGSLLLHAHIPANTHLIQISLKREDILAYICIYTITSYN